VQHLSEAERPALLVLVRQGWQWVTRKLQLPVDLSSDDVALGRLVGAWSLCPSPKPGFSFPDAAAPPLSLSTNLPDNAAKITLRVIPEHQAVQHRTIWRLRLEMDQISPIPEVHVGVGEADRQTTGTRVLSIDRPVEFHMVPPSRDSYWFSFEWRSPQGEWQEAKVELPLRSALFGRAL